MKNKDDIDQVKSSVVREIAHRLTAENELDVAEAVEWWMKSSHCGCKALLHIGLCANTNYLKDEQD